MSKPKFKKLLVLLTLLPVTALPLTSISLKTDKQNNNKNELMNVTRADPAWIERERQRFIKLINDCWWLPSVTKKSFLNIAQKDPRFQENSTSWQVVIVAIQALLNPENKGAGEAYYVAERLRASDSYISGSQKKQIIKRYNTPKIKWPINEIHDLDKKAESTYVKLNNHLQNDLLPFARKFRELDNAMTKINDYYRLDRANVMKTYMYIGTTDENQTAFDSHLITASQYLYDTSDNDTIEASIQLEKTISKAKDNLYKKTVQDDFNELKSLFNEFINNPEYMIYPMNYGLEFTELYNYVKNTTYVTLSNIIEFKKKFFQLFYRYTSRIVLQEAKLDIGGEYYYMNKATKQMFLDKFRNSMAGMNEDKDAGTNYSLEPLLSPYGPLRMLMYLPYTFNKLNVAFKNLKDEMKLYTNYHRTSKPFNESYAWKAANKSLQDAYMKVYTDAQIDRVYDVESKVKAVQDLLAQARKNIENSQEYVNASKIFLENYVKTKTQYFINQNGSLSSSLLNDIKTAKTIEEINIILHKINNSFKLAFAVNPPSASSGIFRHPQYDKILTSKQKEILADKSSNLFDNDNLDVIQSKWQMNLDIIASESEEYYLAFATCENIDKLIKDSSGLKTKLNFLYASAETAGKYNEAIEKGKNLTTVDTTELLQIQNNILDAKSEVNGHEMIRLKFVDAVKNGIWLKPDERNEILTKMGGNPDSWKVDEYWNDDIIYNNIKTTYDLFDLSLKNSFNKFKNVNAKQNETLLNKRPPFINKKVEENLTNMSNMVALYEEALWLEKRMKELNRLRKEYTSITKETVYKYAYPSLRKAYDDAYTASNFTDYKNKDEVDKLITDLETARDNLNGDELELGVEKDKLRAEINASQDLLDNEKTELLQDVDNATDIPQLMAVREKFENKVTANKQTVIDTKALFNSFIDAVNWEETTVTNEWKNVVTTITNIRNLESVKTSLWDTIKASMQTSLVNLVNLNDAQRQVYIAKIPQTLDASSKNFATEYTNAKALDASMLALSEEKANYPIVIATDNYIKADQAKKEAYDQAYANSTFTDAKDKVAVDALKNALISTKNSLNGDANILKAAKDALTKEIQDHPYLEPSQKAILLPKVAAATKLADLDPIRQEMEDYIKSNLDLIKQALKQQINDSKWTTPSEKTSLISKADAMTSTTILQTVAEVTNDLKIMLQSHLQTLANLNQAQKDVLKTEAGSLTKITELFTQYDKAIQLDGTMKTLKDLIESLRDVFNEPNYKEAEEAKKQSFMQAYQALTFIDGKTNDEVLTLIQNANDAKNNLDGLARVQAEKDKLRTEITNDLYLTSDQKLMLGDEVNKANTMAEVWTVKNLKDKLSLENKQKLNAKKEALKAKVNALEIIEASAKPAIITTIDDATITTIDFVELDINNKIKNAFDLLIDSQLNLNQAQKDLLKGEALPENAASTLNDLVTKIKELEKAMKDLADIKYAYKDVKTSALYTEDEQERKEAFDRAYDALTFTDAKTKQEVETLIENVKEAKNALKGVSTLEQAKKDLKTEIENNPKLNPSQKSYFKGKVDAASSFADLDAIRKEISDLEDLDASKAKLITLINQTKWPENSKKQELIKKVEAAASQNFNVIKDEVTGELLSILKAFVQGLTNLNSSQTQHFKDQLKTFGEVKTMNQIFIESEALDKEMKIVNDLINDYKDVTTLSIYLDDIQAKKDRFDIAYLNLKFSENKNREEVIAIIKEAREAKEALNGKLNNEQESLEDLQKQIARATAEAETLIEKTQPLHNNLDIKASVEKLKQLILDGKDPNKINIDLVNSMKSEITKLNELGTGEFNTRIDEKQYLTQVQKDWTKKQYLVAKHSIDVNTVLNNAHELDNLMKILKSEFESLLTKEEYAKTLPGYTEVKQKSKQLLALDGEKDLQQDDDLNDIKDLIPRVKDLNKKASDAMPVPSKQDKISASLRNSAKAGLALNILLFLGLAAIVSMLLTVFKKFR